MEVQPIDILLIEDNPGDIELVRAAFEEARAYNHLTVINDGQEAVEFFEKGEAAPDLILLDINLPKVNGFEVLQKIRATQKGINVPVVILSSSEIELDINRSYSQYTDHFITKPVDFDKFIAVVKSIGKFWLSVVKLPEKKE